MATRPKYGDRRMASSSASRGATCNPVVVEVIDPVMSFAECAIRIDRCRVRNHTEFSSNTDGSGSSQDCGPRHVAAEPSMTNNPLLN